MGVDLGAENRRGSEHGARGFQKAASGKGHNVRIADFDYGLVKQRSVVSLHRLGSGCSRDRAALSQSCAKVLRQPLKMKDLARRLKPATPVRMIQQKPQSQSICGCPGVTPQTLLLCY